jgi:hypothetical protein
MAMKTYLLFVALICLSMLGFAQDMDQGSNHVHEFFIVKCEDKKQIIITCEFMVRLPLTKSLSEVNYEIKKLLAEQLIMSYALLTQEEMGCTYKAIAANSKGEFFDDEVEAARYREIEMNQYRKKGYNIYEYPFIYKP